MLHQQGIYDASDLGETVYDDYELGALERLQSDNG